MNLTQKTVKGVMWTGFSTGSTTLLNFIILAILARLLSPSDFGLMGMVMVVIGFAITIADLGLGAAIIQRQDISHEQLSTVFFLNILLGTLLCTIVYFSSGIIALFFKKYELVNLLKLISFSFIIISLSQTFRTLLQKWMNFKVLAKVEVCGIIIYGISSITFALKGFGVRSLVLGFLIRQTAETILLWFFTGFKPRLVFKLKNTKNLINFGIYVFGERIMNYFNRNLDYIIIGRFLGAEALGFYTLAYQLMLFPISKISNIFGKVTFPAFSMIQNNNEKIKKGYLKVVKYISLVTFPMMAGLFAVAPEFITSIYGAKWYPTILILQILCLIGALQSIGSMVGTVLYAKGRSDIAFKWNVFVVCCTTVAFLIGVNWNIVGVAIAYAIISLILLPIIQNITNKLIDLKMKDFLIQFINQIIGAVIMLIFVLILKLLLNNYNLSQIFTLLSSILTGIIIYMIIILLKDKRVIIEGMEILQIYEE